DTVATAHLGVGDADTQAGTLNLGLAQLAGRALGATALVADDKLIGSEHSLAGLNGGAKFEFERGVLGWRLDTLESVEQGLAAAGLAGALSGLIAADELLGACDVFLLLLVFLLPADESVAAELDIASVVARVLSGAGVGKLKRAGGDAVEKI